MRPELWLLVCVSAAAAMLCDMGKLTMASETPKCDQHEEISMLLRRTQGVETISSDIALRLAEMVFMRVYGKEYADERSPLTANDLGDRWHILSRKGVSPPNRLQMVILKSNGRILDLSDFY